MIAPPLLADEARRLATLHHLNILDTAPEQRFDRLTRLAQRLFNVPMALVSLIDNDRQWIKSSAGLAAVQTPRDVSFCGHAIASDVTLVVPDACLDPRFHDNPFVAGEPHVRFYAGCPLVMPNGSRIGTLCVADSQPRDFDKNDVALLSDLARMVEQEICSVQLHSLDDLTGIASRRAFMGLAQKSLTTVSVMAKVIVRCQLSPPCCGIHSAILLCWVGWAATSLQSCSGTVRQQTQWRQSSVCRPNSMLITALQRVAMTFASVPA
jgi:hypothetical protein